MYLSAGRMRPHLAKMWGCFGVPFPLPRYNKNRPSKGNSIRGPVNLCREDFAEKSAPANRGNPPQSCSSLKLAPETHRTILQLSCIFLQLFRTIIQLHPVILSEAQRSRKPALSEPAAGESNGDLLFESDIQVLHIQSVVFNKLPPRLDILAHQRGENLFRLRQILQLHLEQRSPLGIHGRLP